MADYSKIVDDLISGKQQEPKKEVKTSTSSIYDEQIDALINGREFNPDAKVKRNFEETGAISTITGKPETRFKYSGAEPAGIITNAKAGTVDDINTKMKIYAKARFPNDPNAFKRYGIKDGEIVFMGDDGNLYAEIGDMGGAEKFIGEEIANAPTSILTSAAVSSGQWWAAPVLAAGGEGIRKSIGALVYDEPQTALGNAADMGVMATLGKISETGGKLVTGALNRAGAKRGGKLAVAAGRDRGFIDPLEVAKIEAKGKSFGVDLLPPQTSGSRELIGKAKWLRDRPGTADIINPVLEKQNIQAQKATEEFIEKMGGYKSPLEVGEKLVNASKKAVEEPVNIRRAKASPIYKKAFSETTVIDKDELTRMKGRNAEAIKNLESVKPDPDVAKMAKELNDRGVPTMMQRSEGQSAYTKRVTSDYERIIKKEVPTTGGQTDTKRISQLRAENEAIDKTLTGKNILSGTKFIDENIGSGYGQSDFTLSIMKNDKVIGKVDYSEFDGIPAIKMIDVPEKYRRKGVASELVYKLQEKYPGIEIDWGMQTEDGAGLYKALSKKEIAVNGISEKKKEIANLKEKISKYEKIADKFNEIENPTKSEINSFHQSTKDWNDINDKLYDLENDIDGKKDSTILFEKPVFNIPKTEIKIDINPVLKKLNTLSDMSPEGGASKKAITKIKKMIFNDKTGPETRLEVLDNVKKEIDAMLEGPEGASIHKDVKFKIGQIKDELTKQMDSASPTYERARKIFSEESEAVNKTSKKSLASNLAKLENDEVVNAHKKLIQGSFSNADNVLKARKQIEKYDPEAWRSTVGLYLQDQFNKSKKGDVMNFGGKLYNNIVKDTNTREILRAAMDKKEFNTLMDLSDVLNRASWLAGKESATAERLMINESLRGQMGSKVGRLMQTDLTAPMKKIGQWMDGLATEKDARLLADAMVSEKVSRQLQKMKQLTPGQEKWSRQLVVLTSIVAGDQARRKVKFEYGKSDTKVKQYN